MNSSKVSKLTLQCWTTWRCCTSCRWATWCFFVVEIFQSYLFVVYLYLFWPPDVPASHVAAGPEVLLPLSADEAQELSLLRAAVDRDRSHPVGSAEARRLALSERGATKSPGHEVVASVEAVVRTVASSTPTTSTPPLLFPLLTKMFSPNNFVLFLGSLHKLLWREF